MAPLRHWIGGIWSAAPVERTAPVWNPATGQRRAEVPLAGPAEVGAAVRAASDAAPSWADSSVAARTRILFRFRDLVDRRAGDLARPITEEHGKVRSDALGEVQRGLEVIEYACGVGEPLKGACRFPCRWPTTRSAAGRTRSSGTGTCTVQRGSASTPRAKAVTTRWPYGTATVEAAPLSFPTST
ncbi:aldehyde dehydrogenase family protein [Plantactinospora sp. CA-294935]|uniref:aldehyde dehydrogenase family protein n=1 Tax=Plantactinospora sp. CA-294935 TaxID=3240012 RepID=UPI003D90C188